MLFKKRILYRLAHLHNEPKLVGELNILYWD
jgi:hypothetical protein